MQLNKRAVRVVTFSMVTFLLASSGAGADKNNLGETASSVYARVGNMLIVEGDVFVARADEQTPRPSFSNRAIGISSSLSLWPNGIVPYVIDADLSNDSREMVTRAVEHWNERSSISLVPRGNAQSSSADYLRFIMGPGCASWVGRQGGEQEIWVSDFCTTGSMIHEIGHSLGLLHEHTRQDRDQFITVQWANIQSDKTFNFEISNTGTQDLGPYDYGSIMHYGEHFFSSNGEPTLVPTRDTQGQIIGQRTAASAGDLAAIDRMYQADLGVSATATATGNTSELAVIITNFGQNGAHDIIVDLMDIETTALSGDAQWRCQSQTSGSRCTSSTLPGSSSTTFTVFVPRALQNDDISVQLTAKTHDPDESNNQISSALNQQPAAALPTPSDDRSLETPDLAAVGSMEWLSFAVLLLIGMFWRWSDVVRSQPARAFTTHASTRHSTSPGRTRR